MDAILLAGGYATRLYPLTKNRAKALLPVGGKPIINYVVENLEESEHIERMFLVSNEKFAGDFADWANDYDNTKPITVLNDGTSSNDDRLGAIGDIHFVMEEANLNPANGIYALGTDNLAEFDITSIVDLAVEHDASAIFASEVENERDLTRMGVARVNEEGRVVEFVEKPDNPPSNLAVPPFYAYSEEAARLLPQYLDEGNDPDAPGHLVEWLVSRVPVYARVVEGGVRDIGTREAYDAVRRHYGDET